MRIPGISTSSSKGKRANEERSSARVVLSFPDRSPDGGENLAEVTTTAGHRDADCSCLDVVFNNAFDGITLPETTADGLTSIPVLERTTLKQALQKRPSAPITNVHVASSMARFTRGKLVQQDALALLAQANVARCATKMLLHREHAPSELAFCLVQCPIGENRG